MIKCQWILKTVSTREHKESDLALCSKMSLPCKLICTDWQFLCCAFFLTPFWLQRVCMAICVTKVHDPGWHSLPWGMLCSPSLRFQPQGAACCKGGRVKQVINFTQTRTGSQRGKCRCEALLFLMIWANRFLLAENMAQEPSHAGTQACDWTLADGDWKAGFLFPPNWKH